MTSNWDAVGAIGQCVGSLLTGGSLLLGFYILRLEQQDKRRSQASRVTFTETRSLDPETDAVNGVHGSVYNGSDLPITFVRIVIRSDKFRPANAADVPDPNLITIGEVVFVEEQGRHGPIRVRSRFNGVPPKKEGSFRVGVPSGLRLQPEDLEVHLAFVDGDGRDWRRDSTGELTEVVQRYKRVRRKPARQT